jgi:hypothetical protein
LRPLSKGPRRIRYERIRRHGYAQVIRMINKDLEEDKGFGKKITELEERIAHLEDFIDTSLCAVISNKIKNHYNDCKVERGQDSPEESLDRIYEELLRREKEGPHYITYAQTGELLSKTNARVCQLRTQIKKDKRLVLSWHPINKKLRIITLRRGLKSEGVKLSHDLI